MFHQNYNIYGANKEELNWWISKKLEDVKKDIQDMVDYYGLENIDNIKIDFSVFEKTITKE